MLNKAGAPAVDRWDPIAVNIIQNVPNLIDTGSAVVHEAQGRYPRKALLMEQGVRKAEDGLFAIAADRKLDSF